MKKVYFATPVNGRKEPTERAKKVAALQRCVEFRTKMKDIHPDWAVTFSFNVCPIGQELDEPAAMGRCVELLMRCDALVLDDGWMGSAGCSVERSVAVNYGLKIVTNEMCMLRNVGL